MDFEFHQERNTEKGKSVLFVISLFLAKYDELASGKISLIYASSQQNMVMQLIAVSNPSCCG